jgi:DNA polymerase elongation subunit (family B)
MVRYRKISAEYGFSKYGPPKLRIYGRSETGTKEAFDIEGLPAYFFVPHQPKFPIDLQSKVKRVEEGHKSIFGKPLWKVYTYSPFDIKQLAEGQDAFEADIPWTTRSCIDLGITDGFELSPMGKPIPIDSVDDIKPRIWVLDVEIISPANIIPTYETPQYQTACIVLYDNYDDKQYVFDTASCSEKQMWLDFLKFIDDKDPDIITGWNISFDISWIFSKLSYMGIDPNGLSTMRRANMRTYQYERGLKQIFFSIGGRIIFDGLEAYKVKKNPSGQLSSYNLHAIAEKETGDQWEDFGPKIEEEWEKNPQGVIDYCKKDVEVETKIITGERLIEQAFTLAKLSGCSPEKTVKKEAIIDHAILLRRGERILPSKRRRDGVESKVKGAVVLLPEPGIHRNVGVFDAAALYPSIISGFNISPETKKDEGTIRITDEDGHTYSFMDPKIQKGILPEAITEFRQLRENVRAKKYKAEEKYGHDSPEYKALEEEDTADKFIITSFYGVNGFSGFRLFDPDCANAITAVGRKIILGLKEYLTANGFPVEYGDTDSVFVSMETLDNGDKVSNLIAQFLEKTLQEMGVMDVAIKVKFEKYFSWCIFKRREIKKGVFEPVKKKYVAHMVWSEGQETDYMYIRGFETRRSDVAPILKRTMEEFFDIMRKGDFDGAIKYLKGVKDRWHDVDLMDIAIPRKVSAQSKIESAWQRGVRFGKEFLDLQYDEQTAPSLLYLRGSAIAEAIDVICIQQQHIGKIPALDVDRPKMFEKIIKKKFQPLIEAMGRDWDIEMEGKTTLDQWAKEDMDLL